MSPPPPSALSVLPALSVVLGLPLCGGRTAAAAARTTDAKSAEAQRPLARRARLNASRIYARRVVDRARLERQHPWAANPDPNPNGGRRRRKGGPVGEALAALIDSRGRTDGVESTGEDGAVSTGDNRGRGVALCEGGPGVAAPSQPAEWSDDVDLVARRLEFGKEISPLSDASRPRRWGMACRRVATLAALAAPLAWLVPLNVALGDGAGGSAEGRTADGADGGTTEPGGIRRAVSRATWDYALWAVESAGPTYVKLVQWASTRNDLFSPEFVGHFSRLQDETRGHSWKETEATLERAFGRDWRGVLSFDTVMEDEEEEGGGDDGGEGARLERSGRAAGRERQRRMLERNETKYSAKSSAKSPPPTVPVGSGCVAQVYRARLRAPHGLHPAGTPVAVKVQHPRILEKVCLDFYIFNKLASLLERIPYLNLDYLSVKDSVDQFRDIMLPQLDLRVEAHNLRRFRRDFRGETQIAFPAPLDDLTSREVLVEHYVEGEPMLNFVKREDERHTKKDREELATIGLRTVMEMIFLHDFVHADLHPGNMIVDRNRSVRGAPLRVHMIDCGLTVELGERDHMNLVRILGSLIKRDGLAAGRLMVDTAKKCQATELDVELFCEGIERICVDDEENNFLESVGDYITDICYMACRHKVKLEAAFINAALACEIMEGLASSLYPDMKVQSVALPMVLKAEMMHGLKGRFGYF